MAIQKITSPVVTDNIEFSGTEAVRMPNGTTAQRASAAAGDIRFNTTTNLMEYYDGTLWKGIDAPPVLTTVTGFINEDDTSNIVLTGSNLQAGATVEFYNFSTNNLSKAAPTVTRDSSTQLTVATGNDSVGMTAGVAVSIKVTNPSGLSATLDNALTVEADPTWVTSSGSLATIYDSQRSSYSSISVSATSSTGTVTYAVQSGSLPTGLSLNTSTGAITGTAGAVGSSTTSSFTLRASNDAQNVSFTDRAFSITVREPIVTSFTATGAATLSVPTGVSSVWVVAVAGGGSGAAGNGTTGGGGGGGFIEMPSFPVTPGGSVSLSVGAGGAEIPNGSGGPGQRGTPTTFGTLTAIGGGGAQGWTGTEPNGKAGGSGGGGAGVSSPTHPGGPALQPSQPGNSGTYGYGYPGGAGAPWVAPYNMAGGGGGGAGGAGSSGAVGPTRGNGGVGKASTITTSSVYYAGGGGGTGQYSDVPDGPGGVGGTGGGGHAGGVASRPGNVPGGGGGTNTGGGGGAGTWPSTPGGNGGPGIVLVRY